MDYRGVIAEVRSILGEESQTLKTPSRIELKDWCPEWDPDAFDQEAQWEIIDQYLSKSLDKLPSQIGLSYDLARQIEPKGASILHYNPKSAAWFIYLYPRATQAEMDKAIAQARTILIPILDRARADALSGAEPPSSD